MSPYKSKVNLPLVVLVLMSIGALCQTLQDEPPEYFGVDNALEAEAFLERYPKSYYLHDQLSQFYLEANDLRRSMHFRQAADRLLAGSVDTEYAILQ